MTSVASSLWRSLNYSNSFFSAFFTAVFNGFDLILVFSSISTVILEVFRIVVICCITSSVAVMMWKSVGWLLKVSLRYAVNDFQLSVVVVVALFLLLICVL